MQSRERRPPSMRPLWSMTDIVNMLAGTMSRQAVYRMMDTVGVAYVRVGKSKYVPIQEIMRKLPLVWEAIALVERQKVDMSCPSCRSMSTNKRTR